ncbi:MAG TPA: nucleoside monophosphate kinase [Candidatus Paceibacterota bacterium]
MEIILLYGPPGSGKTTLVEKYIEFEPSSVYLSVGQITRNEIKNKTVLGLTLKKYLDEVVEYPPSLIGELVKRELEFIRLYKNKEKVIIDGFPKYDWEAEYFLDNFNKDSYNLSKIIVIDTSFSELYRRVAERKICSKCLKQFSVVDLKGLKCPTCDKYLTTRDDDFEFVLKRRYDDYVNSLSKTLFFLDKQKGKTINLDGDVSKNELLIQFTKLVR